MTRNDSPKFLEWLGELAEYFPSSKVNLETIILRYFRALIDMDAIMLDILLDRLLLTCRYFPTVFEVVQAWEDLRNTQKSPSTCRRCPGGHGTHEGHRVGHYDTGPFYHTCQADMPPPPGYVHHPPPPTDTPLIPQRTYMASDEEVCEIIEKTLAEMNKRSVVLEHFLRGRNSPEGTYRPRLRHEQVEARRSFLREQSRRLRDGGEDAAS